MTLGRHGPFGMFLVAVVLGAMVAGPVRPARAAHRHHRRHISNMPVGWRWPPTDVMRAEGRRCLSRLDQLGVAWQPGPRTRKITTPVLVPGMELGGVVLQPIWRKPPFVMDCHLAVALADVGPALRALGVRTLRFSSIYEYRRIRVRGHHVHALSRHALGLAIDVYEMVTDDGRTLVVAHDYRRGNATLHQLERALGASPDLRTPLTPGNAPRSHRDHFHLEARVKYDVEPSESAAVWPSGRMSRRRRRRVAAR